MVVGGSEALCQTIGMKKIIHTDRAPAAIGAYSQAVLAGETLYVSGQIPLDPQTMKMVEGGFAEQAQQVFDNLSAIAMAADASLEQAVKFTCYLTDLADFAILNDVMTRYVAQPFPARAAVQVAALPKGALVEVDAILCLSD